MRKVFPFLAILGVGLSRTCLENEVRLDSDAAIAVSKGTAGSWDAPIRCDGPAGERAYLDRLRGPDGEPVRYERLGNSGRGVNGNFVDVYLVKSFDGSLMKEVVFDMYFSGESDSRVVEGFAFE